MTKLAKWRLIFFYFLISFKVVRLGEFGTHTTLEKTNMGDGSNQEGELMEVSVSRNTRSTSLKNTPSPQLKQICGGFGIRPCTCYYPDHPDVVLFELNTDETTKNASKVNGTGPSSCEDLQSMGHNLGGFYLVRFKANRTEAIHCNFNQTLGNLTNEVESSPKSYLKQNYEGVPSETIQFCNGTGEHSCSFLYPDYPDIQLFNRKTKNNPSCGNCLLGPTSCNDLRLIGHMLRGFYIIRRNAKKVKIVYCDFNLSVVKGDENIRTKRSARKKIRAASNYSKPICSSVGSRPCSCYFSKSPVLTPALQFEMGNDKITRNAMDENGIGPATCDDLQKIGYFLDGFYMLRFNNKAIKTVYCKFNELIRRILKKKEEETNRLRSIDPTASTLHVNLETSHSTALMLRKEQRPDCIKFWYLKAGEPFSCLGVERTQASGKTWHQFGLDQCKTDKYSRYFWEVEQKWRIIESENGTIRICQYVWDECIAIFKNVTEDFIWIDLAKLDHGSVSQLWKINTETSQLMNVEYGLCLLVTIRNHLDGGTIVETESCNEEPKTYHFVSRKMWTLVPLKNCIPSSSLHPSTTTRQPKCNPNYATYHLKNQDEDLCLEISKGNSFSLSKCDQSAMGQHWKKIYTPTNHINIVNVNYGNKALTALQIAGKKATALINFDSNSIQQAWLYDWTTNDQIRSIAFTGECIIGFKNKTIGSWTIGIEKCPTMYNIYTARWTFAQIQDTNEDTICTV